MNKQLSTLQEINNSFVFRSIGVFLLIIELSVFPLFGQSFQWAKQFDGGSTANVQSMLLDNKGYIYVAGKFDGVLNYDAASISSEGQTDIFIAKLDCSGGLVWITTIGGVGNEDWPRVSLDSSGGLIVSGSFNDAMMLKSATALPQSVTGAGLDDGFIAKYDTTGNLVWVYTCGGPGKDYVMGLSVDSDGNAYATGEFHGFSITMSSGVNYFNSGIIDGFFVKVDKNGNYVWSKKIGGPTEDLGYTVAVHSNSQSVFLAGSFGYKGSSCVIEGTTYYNGGDWDGFLAKFSLDGVLQWINIYTGPSGESPQHVVCDEFGNSFVGVACSNNSVFSSINGKNRKAVGFGNRDLSIAKYSPSGNLLWMRNLGSSGYDVFRGLGVFDSKYIYITGEYSGAMAYEGINFPHSGSSDIVLMKFNTDSTLLWTYQNGTSNFDIGLAVGLGQNEEIFLAGASGANMSFGSTTFSNPNAGFIVKMCPMLLQNRVVNASDTFVCPMQDSVLLSVEKRPDFIYTWERNDTTLIVTSSNELWVNRPGNYSVSYSLPCCVGESFPAKQIYLRNTELSLGPDLQYCYGDSVTLGVSPPGTNVIWPDGSIAPVYTLNLIKDTVVYAKTTGSGCIGADTLLIKVLPKPLIVIDSLTQTVFVNEPGKVKANVLSAKRFYWLDDNGNLLDTNLILEQVFSDTGTFSIKLIAENELGCSDTAEATIKVIGERYIHIPNSFTPDEDGLNDVFQISYNGLEEFEIAIYNRWGELIFQSSLPDLKPWDGNYKGLNAPEGVYLILYRYKFLGGKERKSTNTINLIRLRQP